ncbi:phage integrase N-terminal SAM-like domain-containing protein [Nostoc sp.]|uniref:phage integrase N-terminal SAM-like domain-containing protein n=1 Tax=Nostoc sp. TaxID=1180 RepID=UPI003FA52B26
MEKYSNNLLERVQKKIRLQHHCYQTEKSYIDLIRRYICFHNQRYAKDMVSVQIRALLRHLAVKKTSLHQFKVKY